MSGKYSQKFIDHAKQSATDSLKTMSKIVIKNTVEATGDLIGNRIPVLITKVSKNSEHTNSESVTNEHDKEKPKERYLSPEEDRKLLMIWVWYNCIIIEYQKIINFLDNMPNQPTKFRTKYWVEISDDAWECITPKAKLDL